MKPLLVLTLLCFFVGCTGPRHAAKTPSLSAATRQSTSVTETINLSSEDSKAVKKAIMELQLSNVILHKLNGEAVLILDRMDYKTKKLLE